MAKEKLVLLILVISILTLTTISAEEFGYNLFGEPIFDNTTGSVNNSIFCGGFPCIDYALKSGDNLPITGGWDFGSNLIFNVSNITADFFIGDGSQLTNIAAGNPFDQSLNTTDNVSFNNLTINNEAFFEEEAIFNSGTITFEDAIFKRGINEATISGDTLGRIMIDAATTGAFPYVSITPHASTTFGMVLWHPAGGAFTNFKTVDSSPDYLSIAIGTSGTFGGYILNAFGQSGFGTIPNSAYKVTINGDLIIDERIHLDRDNEEFAIGASQDVSQLFNSTGYFSSLDVGNVPYFFRGFERYDFDNDLNIDGFLNATTYHFTQGGNLTSNSSCLIFSSPDGTTTSNICNVGF